MYFYTGAFFTIMLMWDSSATAANLHTELGSGHMNFSFLVIYVTWTLPLPSSTCMQHLKLGARYGHLLHLEPTKCYIFQKTVDTLSSPDNTCVSDSQHFNMNMVECE